jgi:hypothetical protein
MAGVTGVTGCTLGRTTRENKRMLQGLIKSRVNCGRHQSYYGLNSSSSHVLSFDRSRKALFINFSKGVSEES